MKKIIALLLTLLFVFGLASFAAAEWGIPGDKVDRGGFIGKDTRSLRIGYINTLVGEGATSDTNETTIYYADPSSDNVIIIPDDSGTITLQDGSGSLTLSGDDAQILVHNGTEYGAQTVSGDLTITNAGVASIEAGTDAQMLIYNTGDAWGPKTLSGDVTITNAGVVSIGASKVGTAEANINSVALMIADSTASNSVAVESGSTLMGWYLSNGAGAITPSSPPVYINTVEWDGTTFLVSLNAAGTGATEVTGTFLRP
jgi:hypothetical protein